MRTEAQVQERIERLRREQETLRTQIARAVLSDKEEEQCSARDLMDRLRHADVTLRALDWAFGGKER